VEIETEGKADYLKTLIDRLKAIGAQPPQAKVSSKAEESPVPICPIHGSPMKVSRRPGSFFCPKRDAVGGYCRESYS
jgi:hypothetical protein